MLVGKGQSTGSLSNNFQWSGSKRYTLASYSAMSAYLLTYLLTTLYQLVAPLVTPWMSEREDKLIYNLLQRKLNVRVKSSTDQAVINI